MSEVFILNPLNIVKDFIGQCWHSKTNQTSIPQFLTENCLHQKTIGKCIGNKSFLTDCNDWSRAFPDYDTKIESIQKFRNLVICDVNRTGTHLYKYQSTNSNKKTILSKSDFLNQIEDLKPTGARYSLPEKLIFGFEGSLICQIIIEEHPLAMLNQLGLLSFPQNIIKENFLEDETLLINALNASLGVSLSKREIECLALGFCGFSAKHIAEILKITYRTVESFFYHAYQKLNCFGKQSALDLMHQKQVLFLWFDLGKLLLKLKIQNKYGIFLYH